MNSICFLNVAAGLIIAASAAPLILGKIPPNRWYGFRTPKTLRDPAIWYSANAYAGRWLLAAGLIIAAAAVALSVTPKISIEAYSFSMLAVTLLTVGVAVVQSVRYLNRLEAK